MSKKYYWLKLKDDFFNQREIKKLRKVAGGDTFVIIYLKMQLLSIKTEGNIRFEGTEDNILDQLELELDEDKNNIALTLSYLTKHKLLEVFDDDYFLPKACENIGKESDSAERVRRHRQKTALQSNDKALQSNECNVTSNTEKEIYKDIEKEIYKNIVEYLNEKTGKEYRHTTKKTKDMINARLNEGFTENDFKRVIDVKSEEWLNKKDMEIYLRPETLFSNKFEGYLNQGKVKVVDSRPDQPTHEDLYGLPEEVRKLYGGLT